MRKYLAVLCLLVFPLAGCEGIEAETPAQKLVVAETAFQEALVAINRLIDAGVITSENAAEVQAGRASAKAALDAARTAFDADLPTSVALISAANTAVTNLNSILSPLLAKLEEGS